MSSCELVLALDCKVSEDRAIVICALVCSCVSSVVKSSLLIGVEG